MTPDEREYRFWCVSIVYRRMHSRDCMVVRDWQLDRYAGMTPAESARADLLRWEEATRRWE